jgi:hypothetical protein
MAMWKKKNLMLGFTHGYGTGYWFPIISSVTINSHISVHIFTAPE